LVDDVRCHDPAGGCDLVLKADGIIGGVHFFPDDPPDTIAKKALRVNLSTWPAKRAAARLSATLACRRRSGGVARTVRGAASARTRNFSAVAVRWRSPIRTPGPIPPSCDRGVRRGAALSKMVRRFGAVPGDLACGDRHIGDARSGSSCGLIRRRRRRMGMARDQQDHLNMRYLVPHPRNDREER